MSTGVPLKYPARVEELLLAVVGIWAMWVLIALTTWEVEATEETVQAMQPQHPHLMHHRMAAMMGHLQTYTLAALFMETQLGEQKLLREMVLVLLVMGLEMLLQMSPLKFLLVMWVDIALIGDSQAEELPARKLEYKDIIVDGGILEKQVNHESYF